MKASVVINTYNRASYLGNAVRSIAQQTYPDIELVIVDGPSTDGTSGVLQGLQERGYTHKFARCPSRNLSESRNIGIANASGDVVLFIDDDGVAHPRWIERVMAAYADPKVGAAGGFTIDHTGVSYQCKYTVCNRLGEARYFDTLDPASLLNGMGRNFYPSLLGTNSSFRRNLLEEIGGFDEVFAYMLDETDVCLRLFERGHRIVTVPDALVFHKYAPSHTRSAERIPTSLLAPARSKVYFMLKHNKKGAHDAAAVFQEIEKYKREIEFSNRWFLDHGKVSIEHFSRLMSELHEGVVSGLTLGLDTSVKQRVSQHLLLPRTPFEPIRLRPSSNQALKIYFVSQGFPPGDTSGIARWTHESAQALTSLGHEVHVITRSRTEASHVDFVDGVWVHSVVDLFPDEPRMPDPLALPDSLSRRAAAVLKEIERAIPIWGADIVSAPIWDLEGIACAEHLKNIPVVTSLHTTYLLTAPYKPEWTSNREYQRHHVKPVIEGERWLLGNSAAILANSKQIIREIDSGYSCSLETSPIACAVVPHGVSEHHLAKQADPASRATGGRVQLLFVGRIERRKGQDLLLTALGQISKDVPDFDLTFVGAAPDKADSYYQDVDRLIARTRARFPRSSISLLGHVDDTALLDFYRGCDIFIATSRFESFGLILVEAMRFGKPIVACAVGGVPDVVENGVEGFLVNPDNSGELAARLQTLMSSGQTRAQMGSRALSRFQRDFTSSAMGLGLESFFYSVLTTEKKNGSV